MYSRLHDSELRKYLLLVLMAEGLIRQEKILSQDNLRHALRMTGRNRANATKTVYRITSQGYEWLQKDIISPTSTDKAVSKQ